MVAHLGRCQRAMEKLIDKYPTGLTPPPFQSVLVRARDRSLSPQAVAELKAMRDRDLDIQQQRRQESIVSRGPRVEHTITDTGPSPVRRDGGGASRRRDAAERSRRTVMLVVAGLIGLALTAVILVVFLD